MPKMPECKDYYCYVYYDDQFVPYYVGKGCRDRVFQRRKEVPVAPENRIVMRYFQEQEYAFQQERQLIAFWGRREYETNGLLMNQALGGPGSPGVPCSEELKQANSQRMSAFLDSISPEERAKNSSQGGKANAAKKAKDYIFTDPDGNEFTVKGMRPFCKRNNLNRASMQRIVKGQRKYYHGWTVRYVE